MLRESLHDKYYNYIQGTTDSEHAFALFLNLLGNHIYNYTITDLSNALISTIKQIEEWAKLAGIVEPSHLNFAVSDGYDILVSRHVLNSDAEPPSLYISSGERIEIRDGMYHMAPIKHHPNAVIIASEPLTGDRSEWQKVKRNHLVLVSPELHIQQLPVE